MMLHHAQLMHTGLFAVCQNVLPLHAHLRDGPKPIASEAHLEGLVPFQPPHKIFTL